MARRRTKKTTDIDERENGSIVNTITPATEYGQAGLVEDTVRLCASDDIRTHIEKLAYELYQRAGCRDGHDREDWLEAERLAFGQQTTASRNGNGSNQPLPSLM
jgi:hypothetical protein